VRPTNDDGRSRGEQAQTLNSQLATFNFHTLPDASLKPLEEKLPSKRWRDLILRVWHVDPLRCSVCQSPMRVIAVIDDPWVVEQILRNLGVWHDPPPRPPPQGLPGAYTYEPCDDVDPAPDYENVLTD
jgi:hypothetical protein